MGQSLGIAKLALDQGAISKSRLKATQWDSDLREASSYGHPDYGPTPEWVNLDSRWRRCWSAENWPAGKILDDSPNSQL